MDLTVEVRCLMAYNQQDLNSSVVYIILSHLVGLIGLLPVLPVHSLCTTLDQHMSALTLSYWLDGVGADCRRRAQIGNY
jgi:hypothetical protein